MVKAEAKRGGEAGWEAVRLALFAGAGPPLGLDPIPGAPSLSALSAALAACAPAATLPSGRQKLLRGLACLWHGHWEQAHQAAQEHEGDPDFDLLHALVHRREGDYANSGYWFAQAGKHPCYAALDDGAGGPWSARAFLSEVREGRGKQAAAGLLALQANEYLAFARYVLGR